MSSVPQAAKTAALASGWPRCHDLMLRAYHLAPACRQPLFRLAPKVDLASTPEPGSPGRCARVFFFTIFFFSGSSPALRPRHRPMGATANPLPDEHVSACSARRPRAETQLTRARRHTMLRESLVSQQPKQRASSLKHSTRDAPPAPMIGRGRTWTVARSGQAPSPGPVLHAQAQRHFMWGTWKVSRPLDLANHLADALRYSPDEPKQVRIRKLTSGATDPRARLFTLHQPSLLSQDSELNACQR